MSESEKEFVILVTLLRYDDKLNYFWRKCEWCFLWQKSALGSHWIIDNTCNINTISIMTVLVVNTSNSPIAHIFCLILSLIFDWNRCVKRYVMAQCPCREDLQRVVFTEWSSCPFCWKTHVHACCNPLTCSERTSRDTADRNTLQTLTLHTSSRTHTSIYSALKHSVSWKSECCQMLLNFKKD